MSENEMIREVEYVYKHNKIFILSKGCRKKELKGIVKVNAKDDMLCQKKRKGLFICFV